MTEDHSPIFCGRCRVLALAKLEGVPLCPSCLMTAVKASGDPHVVNRIRPLFVGQARLKNIVRARKKVARAKDRPERSSIGSTS
jgi:hypothetical protein